jgi:hypothetical protein
VSKRKHSSTLKEIEAISDDVLTLDHYPPVSPVGDGIMPLSAPIHWIATDGLRTELLLTAAESRYRAAAVEIGNKIVSGKFFLHGENSNRDREVIPAIEFEELIFTFDFVEGVEDVARHDRRVEIGVGEDGDCLFVPNSHRPKWTKLVVSKEAVFREWPLSLITEEAAYTVIPDRPFRGPKIELARLALLQEFSEGRVPKHLTSARITKRLNQRRKTSGDLGGFDRTTVLRALGLRK